MIFIFFYTIINIILFFNIIQNIEYNIIFYDHMVLKREISLCNLNRYKL
jgi:hypothetical protein